jgi:ferredoxin-type protein NapF
MDGRRELFKSFTNRVDQESLLVRPPYFREYIDFESCKSCEDRGCISACPEKIIVVAQDGSVTLDFSKNGCSFCDECANLCEAGVLSLENSHTSSRLNAIFQIDFNRCVAHHGVICSSCREPCIDDAILFNGLFNPVIDSAKCTSCGFCISRCPTSAIEYSVK